MGDLERTPHRRDLTVPPKRTSVGTVVWLLVLAGSALAIAAGYAGGRRYAATALQPQARVVQPPEQMRARTFDRVLTGAESFDPSGDEPDPYGDAEHAVASRPAGWAPLRFDDRFVRPRIALMLIDGDRSTSAFAGFAAEPFPLAVLIGPDAPASALGAIRAAGKTAYAACDGESVATVIRLRRGGAAGIACSTDDPGRAAALVQANRGGIVFDDLVAGDALYRAARAVRARASTRDVFADARDDDAYVDSCSPKRSGSRGGPASRPSRSTRGRRRCARSTASPLARSGTVSTWLSSARSRADPCAASLPQVADRSSAESWPIRSANGGDPDQRSILSADRGEAGDDRRPKG
ncbi:MAG: hypothetical protein ABI186_02725 [Candidatus Elarobacter sp.]